MELRGRCLRLLEPRTATQDRSQAPRWSTAALARRRRCALRGLSRDRRTRRATAEERTGCRLCGRVQALGAAHARDVALGHEALPMSALVSDLYRRHQDRLAIVVGGGPSAPEQLEKIGGLSSPIVISANGHANKLGLVTDYVVCKDHTHTETKALMEPQLRT